MSQMPFNRQGRGGLQYNTNQTRMSDTPREPFYRPDPSGLLYNTNQTRMSNTSQMPLDPNMPTNPLFGGGISDLSSVDLSRLGGIAPPVDFLTGGIDNFNYDFNNTGMTGGGGRGATPPIQPDAPANNVGFNPAGIGETLLSYYQSQRNKDSARAAGELAMRQGANVGQTAADMASFKPYTVTGSLASGATTAEGGLDLQLSPEELARQQARFEQAEGLFGRVGVDPSAAQRDLYEQIRATQRPEEERTRLAMQQGLFSSGRGGVSQGQYGGSSAEQFGFDLAQAEARNKAALAARTQVMSEQEQALNMANKLTALGYTPQEQAIGLFGAGNAPAGFADAARRQAGSLYGTAAIQGLEGLLQGEKLAQEIARDRDAALQTALLGSTDLEGQPTGDSLFDYGSDVVKGLWDEYNPFTNDYFNKYTGSVRGGYSDGTSGGNRGSSQAGSYTGEFGTGGPGNTVRDATDYLPDDFNILDY